MADVARARAPRAGGAPRGRADAAARRAGGRVRVRRCRRRCPSWRRRGRGRSTRSPSLLAGAERPAIIAGRGAVLAGAGPALRRLGEQTGALLATSAVANGLFAGDPYALGIAGGFSSPVAAGCWPTSDVVVAFGAALNQWTTRHGTLIAAGARVVQVDLDADAIGAHRPVEVGVVGDAAGHRRGARRPRSTRGTARRPPHAPRSPTRSPPARGSTSRTRTPPRRPARPAHAHARARRDAPARAHRGRRLRRTSWAGRRCTCASRTPPASCSRRPSSASGSGSATRSARRSRGPTG